MLKEKSLLPKAISMITTQSVSRPQQRVDRAPRDVDPAPVAVAADQRGDAAKTAATKASARAALPRLAAIRRGELRRALGDQGVAFADEGAVLDFAGEDDLAAAAEGVRDRACVGDRQARLATFAIGDAEARSPSPRAGGSSP